MSESLPTLFAPWSELRDREISTGQVHILGVSIESFPGPFGRVAGLKDQWKRPAFSMNTHSLL
jgi:hypothetical protein